MALMTQKAYAAKKGVSPQYINKLVGHGKIRLREGKVDPRQADPVLASTTRLRITPVKRTAKKAAAKKAVVPKRRRPKPGRPATDPHETRSDSARPMSATRSYAAARAENEYYKAQQSKLLYEQTIGTLLPKQGVLEHLQKIFIVFRTRLRRMPRQNAPILFRATSMAEVESILLQEVDLLLEELAGDPLGEKQEAVTAVPEAPPEVVQASAMQNPTQEIPAQ